MRRVAETKTPYVTAGDLPKDDLTRLVKDLEKQMKRAARELEFEKAALLRDQVLDLRKVLAAMEGPGGGSLDPEPDRRLLRLVAISEEELARQPVYRAVGCNHCGDVGYHGRKAIFELMRMNNELRELAFNQASLAEIRAAALRTGMRTLLEDGKLKILRGETTPGEVARFAQAKTLIEANIDI